MGNIPKVTIIVPIYNVEKYLCTCLESIINQTLAEIEIICINDGSPDRSADILRKYANEDSRIVVIDKKNCGYGAAINDGLKIANGEYIGIVEPDDFIDSTMYQILYEKACQYAERPDIVKAAYWEYQENTRGAVKKAAAILKLNPPSESFNVYDYPDILNHHPCTVTAIYRRQFLCDNKISYMEAPGAAWTDNPFFFATICLAKTIVWVPSCLYYYRQDNPEASSFLKDCRIPFQRLIEIFDFIDKEEIKDGKILVFLYKRVFLYLNGILNNPNYNRYRDHFMVATVMKRLQPNLLNGTDFNRLEKKYYRQFTTNKTNILEYTFPRKLYISLPYRIRRVIQIFGEKGGIYTIRYIIKKCRKKRRKNAKGFSSNSDL